MEIYRRSDNVVEFIAPEDSTPVTATASLNGGEPTELQLVDGTATTNPKRVRLPYIAYEGTVKVMWSFPADTFNGNEEVTATNHYDVVTPILSKEEIKAIHPHATDEEVLRIEKATRHIINAHCGQKFGEYVGPYNVRGNGSRALHLPSRLLELNKVSDRNPGNWFRVSAEGWVLNYSSPNTPPVKADYYGLHQHVGGVIHNPGKTTPANFSSDSTYKIDGRWGWEEVPAQVAEAAKLLVNDYACADTAYRDRYLTSMTAADWRIQFYSGAFQQTGNVRADQLLSDYVLRKGWVVI